MIVDVASLSNTLETLKIAGISSIEIFHKTTVRGDDSSTEYFMEGTLPYFYGEEWKTLKAAGFLEDSCSDDDRWTREIY